MGNAKIRPPVESIPLNRLTKKFVTGDYVRDTTPYDNFMQIGSQGASRQMGEI